MGESLADGFRSKKAAELGEVCQQADQLLDTVIEKVQGTASAESMVFYLKMKGDYYRYLGEFENDQAKRSDRGAQANQAYAQGMQMAAALESWNAVRLGIALNYSVFQHEVLQDSNAAVNTATLAFNEVASQIDSIPADKREDSITTIQLLRDNLTLWTGQ